MSEIESTVLQRHCRDLALPNMTSTPPRTPSRSHTPSPSPRPTAHLSSPSFQPRFTPSRSVSHATLSALPPRLHVSAQASTAVSSPASSVYNVDLTEGILLRDPDTEDVAESEEQVEGVFADSQENGEERKKMLRDNLRRSLSRKNTSTPPNTIPQFSCANL